MFGSDGPGMDVAVSVGRSRRGRLSAPGASVQSPLTVRALIDTGSDLSVVHPQILRQLGVSATGSVRIRRPGAGAGFHTAWLFEIQLSIGGVNLGALWIPTRVAGVAP